MSKAVPFLFILCLFSLYNGSFSWIPPTTSLRYNCRAKVGNPLDTPTTSRLIEEKVHPEKSFAIAPILLPKASRIAQQCLLALGLVATPLRSGASMLPFSTTPVSSYAPAAFVSTSVSQSAAAAAASSSRPMSSLDHHSILLATATTTTAQPSTSTLEEVWNLVDKYYVDKSNIAKQWQALKPTYERRYYSKANNDKMAQLSILSDMVANLHDKYSRILDDQQYAAIQRFDLIGVGATLMPQNGRIVVGAPPIPQSAADRAGIKVGDGIAAVNGISTSDKTAFDIIDEISQHPNAKTITMAVVPALHVSDTHWDEYATDVVLQRTLQQVDNPIQYKMIDSNGEKVGFIRLLEFNSLVLSKLEDALAALNQAGATAYVLDLRHNTGGAFQSAVEISSLFVKNAVATYVVDNTATQIPFKTAPDSVMVDSQVPVVIWLDGKSASASEVLAGSLHDNCRALTMGSQSFGKGLIQAVYGLQNGAGLVLTVAKYRTPSGMEIQGVGILPDIPGGVGLPIPGLSTDVSQVDFNDVRSRLEMCQVPKLG